jgi:two-component system NarL family response regulator
MSGPAEKTIIRIALADDHAMVREGIRGIIERQSDMRVVVETAGGADLIAQLRKEPVDVVVCDVAMPGINGLEVAQAIQQEKLPVKVIALSAHTDREYVVGMLQAGAAGFIVKASAGEELIKAIRTVYANGNYLSPQVAGELVKQYGPGAPGPAALRPREQEVLRLLAQGLSSKQISRALKIAVRTVESHRRNLSRRLNIRSIAELTQYAIREKIIRFDE